MEPGEKVILDFFLRNLDETWEIYIQPHLNGLRPDFVLLNPGIGIGVFEVKNWNLDAMAYRVESRLGKAPILLGKNDGHDFMLKRENPVEQIFRYKREIQDLYCPRLDGRSGFAAITAGIIFPSADDDQVRSLLAPSLTHRGMTKFPKYNPVSGRNAIMNDDLATVFPEASRSLSRVMTEELAADLRNWLIEPDADKVQRRRLTLDDRQREIVSSRTTSGFRLIKGPAGSGKSIVLAARAARLIEENKDVLVVSFNITLLNYLGDAAVCDNPRARCSGTWLNFHHWCKRVCQDADMEEEYNTIWHGKDDIPDGALCDVVGKALDQGTVDTYDAILVDEGQDIHPRWWNLLRRILRKGGEMLLAADATQDIYDTARAWTDMAMNGAGFTGDWTRLALSYRLPFNLIKPLRLFWETYRPMQVADLPEDKQPELDFGEASLRWIQEEGTMVEETVFRETMRILTKDETSDLAFSDITVLVDSRALGLKIEKRFATEGIRVQHTFATDNREGRRKKLAFFMGAPRVKMTTIHSFKGWEARLLVVCVEDGSNFRGKALLYTGMTRLKVHTRGSYLTVICLDPALAEYGKTWGENESNLIRHDVTQMVKSC